MKTYLLPSKFLVPSGIIFYASVLLGVLLIVFPDLSQTLSIDLSVPNFFWKDADNLLVEKSFWIQNNIIDELLTLLLVGSGLIHLFSKEKQEDEFIMQLRFHAMKWSYLLNFTVLAIGSILVYGLPYFNVMLFCLFSQLVCYHLVFRIFVLQHLRK
jgi:membrane-associated PAP2 superfamily phosphatase